MSQKTKAPKPLQVVGSLVEETEAHILVGLLLLCSKLSVNCG